MLTLEETAKKLYAEKSVAVFTHVRPDGDAVGSSFALCLSLKKRGIEADLFYGDVIPARFDFLVKGKTVKSVIDREYSAFVAVDSADINRLGVFAEDFSKHKNTYQIDHHTSNTRYAKNNCIVDMPSNSENVYEVIKASGTEIDSEIADFLAMGILTDTGNFQHKFIPPKTFCTASELVKSGADINEISYYMFNSQTKSRAMLFGLVMAKIRYFQDDKFAVISIFQKDFEKTGAKPDETEGFIDFVMGIDCVKIGASVMEIGENKYKISFRSKGPDVSAVAGSFGGGGHVLASGCQISGEYEEVIDKIDFAVSRYIED